MIKTKIVTKLRWIIVIEKIQWRKISSEMETGRMARRVLEWGRQSKWQIWIYFHGNPPIPGMGQLAHRTRIHNWIWEIPVRVIMVIKSIWITCSKTIFQRTSFITFHADPDFIQNIKIIETNFYTCNSN